jgi:hypothetical protein
MHNGIELEPDASDSHRAGGETVRDLLGGDDEYCGAVTLA